MAGGTHIIKVWGLSVAKCGNWQSVPHRLQLPLQLGFDIEGLDCEFELELVNYAVVK